MKKYDLIYFMGDSWTFAIGQYEDVNEEITQSNRWTGLVASHFGLEEVNNSIAGVGNLSICRKTYEDVLKFVGEGKKILAVISYSDPNRVELYNEKHSKLLVLNNSQWEEEFYKTYITTYNNYIANSQQTIFYISTVRTLFERHNIDYVENFAFTKILDIPYFSNKTMLDKTLLNIAGNQGRFSMYGLNGPPGSLYGHANVLGNKKIADAIIEKITKEYFV